MKRNGTEIRRRAVSLFLALTVACGILFVPQRSIASIFMKDMKEKRYIYIYKNWDGTELSREEETGQRKGGGYNGPTPVKPSDELFNYTFSGWNKNTKRNGNVFEDTYIAQYTATLRDPNKREIVWKDYNGSELKKEYLNLNTMPSWSGNPPARASDARIDYTFSGWSPALTAVTDNAAYTAQYSSSPAKYTVTWKNQDGTVLKTAQNVEYDAVPSYDGAAPVRNPDAQYTYAFDSWDRADSVSDRTITLTARYRAAVRKYAITWRNYDGTVQNTAEADYGSLPSCPGETPARADDATYRYTFSGWSPAVAKVTGPAAYTAAYTAELRDDFTVTWKNWDGTGLETDLNVNYGSMPEYNGAPPKKASDARYSYTFLGWVPELTETVKDTAYTASFLPIARSYTVTWKDWDGGELSSEEMAWGDMPEYAYADPRREPDAQHRYIFDGWDPAVSAVTGNTVYTARYSTVPAVYTVRFRDEDGLTAFDGVEDQSVCYGEYAAEPAFVPVKEGYRFLAWKTEDGSVFDFGEPVRADEPVITLTPAFGRLYTVSRDQAEVGGSEYGTVTWKGETGEAAGQDLPALEGEQISLTAAPAEGYVLSGFSVRYGITEGDYTRYVDVPWTVKDDNRAVFSMPAYDVLVTAAFALSGDQILGLKDPDNENLYHIRNEMDLILLSRWGEAEGHDMAGMTVQLDRDLNMAGLRFGGFSRPFRGTFDGRGHTVSGVEVYGISPDTYSHVAFFWDLEGSVTNLTVTGSTEDGGGNETGGLVGHLRAGASVSGCTAVMQADQALVCSQWPGSTISGCLYAGSGSDYGTPLYTVRAGSSYTPNADAVISDPAGTGMRVIDGKTYFAAGSGALLTLTAPEAVGNYELAGFKYGNDSYLVKNGQNRYTVQGISGDLTISPDYNYQMGLDYENGKYLIRSAADLEAVARAVRETGGCGDMTFLMMNDVDFGGAAFSGIAVGTADSFYGTFDGNGKTISNMVIASGASNTGFIGQLGGTVKSLTLRNCTVVGTRYAAMLAGGGSGGTVQDCRVLGGKVEAQNAGALYLDSYANYGGGTNNLYDTNVTVVSGGVTKEPGSCGTCYGDVSYNGSNAAVVIWTVRFMSGSGQGGVEVADPQKVADRCAAVRPAVTVALPLPEHFFHTGEWTRGDGTVYTFDSSLVSDQITEDTDLFPVLREEEKCTITLTDGQENGQTLAAEAYVSETEGWTAPECAFAPPVGMEFEGWDYGNLVYEPGQAVALTGEKILTARWKWIEYSVFASDGEETEEIGTAHYGEIYGFYVSPDPGQETVSVTCTGADGENVEVIADEEDPGFYSFVMPDGNVTVTASFRTASYVITASGLEHAALLVNGVPADLSGEVTAHYGDAVTVRPEAGYLLTGLEVKDAVLNAVETNNGMFSMPALDVEIVALIGEGYPEFGTPDFTMPSSLTSIGESAFEGNPMMSVVEAGHCTSIGKNAFKGCVNLTRIRLPAGCDIDPTAFSGCGTVYVFAPAGGTTETGCAAVANCVFVAVTAP